MRHQILLVEDDETIGRVVRDSLVGNGYAVEWSKDGVSATAAIDTSVPDLVLLDAGLPDIDGFSLCRSFRDQHRALPILLVTARDSEIDIVVGLDAGANDYVTKPFSMNVLLARIRVQLRSTETTTCREVLQVGALFVDQGAYSVTVDGAPVDLRRREMELLVLLCREAGRVVTRDRLLAEVWGLHWETSTKTIDMHVMALRRKLGDAIDIVTVRGVGYRLVDGRDDGLLSQPSGLRP